MTPSFPSPPDEPDPALGRVLQDLREKRGMSRGDLAARAGVDEELLAQVEAGTTDPSWTAVGALAGALSVSLEDLAAAVVAEEPDRP